MIDQLTLLYLVFGVRWAFYGRGCVEMGLDFVAMCGGFVAFMTAVGWCFKASDERAAIWSAGPACEQLGKPTPAVAARPPATCHLID